MKTEILKAKSTAHRQALDLTGLVAAFVAKAKAKEGLCHLFIQHTTAALAVGEAGEGTAEDLLESALKMVPKIDFRHGHDPSHAPDHMAASVVGPSLTVPIVDGKLALGTWQQILLLEWNGPRERSIVAQVID